MNVTEARAQHARWRHLDNRAAFLDIPALALVILGFGRGAAVMPAWLATIIGTFASVVLLVNGLIVKPWVRGRREDAMLAVLMAEGTSLVTDPGKYGVGANPAEDEP